MPRPLYAFNYEIVDDGRFGSSGNGNGIAETGETVALVLRVTNIGGGPSEKTLLSLKNQSGDKIFLEKGRSELENLLPEEIRETYFTFNVTKEESSIDFEIQIVDEIFRDGITNNVVIPINANVSPFKANKQEITVTKDNTPIRGGGFAEAPIIAITQKGSKFSSEGNTEGWVKVFLDKKFTGWINKDKIRSNENSESAQFIDPQYQETFEAPPVISLTDLPVSTKSNVVNLFGDIEDQDGIELISVFIGDNKVALLPSHKTSVPVSIDIELQENINLITVIAKDSKGLLSKQSFVVRKEG